MATLTINENNDGELRRLERLSRNPHYTMTNEQLARLRALQDAQWPTANTVRHSTKVPKHDTSARKEDDEPSRSTVPTEDNKG